MTGMRRRIVVSGLAALVACGGTSLAPKPDASSDGSGVVNGKAFVAASEFAIILPTQADMNTCIESADGGNWCTASSAGQALGVSLTNRSDLTCATLESDEESGANTEFANFDALVFEVLGKSGPVTVGTYNLVTGSSTAGANATFQTTSATCASLPQLLATSGTITFTQITATYLAGSYAVTFGTHGSLSGTFGADVCALTGGPLPTGPPTCTP